MIIAIQQPEHLPWLGFFDKMGKCDTFVFLDNVQFKKRYFENRNKIRTKDGWQWVTVPVISKGKFTQKINEVEIDNSRVWKRKYLESIKRSYSKSPFFTEYYPELEKLILNEYQKLIDLNTNLILWIKKVFNIATKCITASELIARSELKGSRLILEICKVTNTETYISGPDGQNYLELKEFDKAGINVIFHDFKHPEYTQVFPGNFISHMSAMDYIFNHVNKIR